MTGGSEKAAGKKDGGPTLTAQVPVGWQRKVEDGAVAYMSPSGTVLCSVEEVRVYLLTDGTCKCGLECPLVLHKVFNFDPTAGVHAQSHQSGKVEEDMTKLCNHRRKVVAMAALCRSMQASQIPLPAHGSGSGVCSVDGKDKRGSVVARGDVAQRACTTQLTLNQARPSSSGSFPVPSPLSLLQNGSVSHTTSILTSDSSSPLKKTSPQSPGPSVAAYGKQQWSPRPVLNQTILQRAPHKPISPSTTKLDTTHTYQMDSSLPLTFSSPSSSSSPVIARAGQPHLQGMAVKSSPPLSLCSSPSCAQDTFSPHQRSRHSSTSSLSEGAPGSMLIQGVKPSPSPLPPTQTCSSPKLSVPPTSPRSRLEGILQHYKDCSTTNPDSAQQHHTFSSKNKLHTLQSPQPAQNNSCDKRNGPVLGSAPGLIGLPLGQILCQQKSQQHISSSFPASSLLSAAAKAQLASQKKQNQSRAAETGALPLPALDKEQQSKVLISTLNSSLSTPTAPTQSLTAFLLPHSPSLPVSNPVQSEKTLRRKRQRRSPTVLSMLKESQVNRTVGDLVVSSPIVPSPSLSSSSSPPPVTHSENHLQPARLSGTPPSTTSVPNSILRQTELEEGKRMALSNSLPLSSPPASSQPLSALLQLLSMQNAQNNTPPTIPPSRHPSSPPLGTSQTPQYDSQLGPQTHIHMKQSQPQNLVPTLDPLTQLATAQPLSLTCEDTEAVAVNLKTTANSAVLNLSLPHTSTSAGTEPSNSSHTLGVMSQLSSATCQSASTVSEKTCGSKLGDLGPDHNIYQTNQPDQNQATDSEDPVISEEQQNLETKLLSGCDPDPNLSLSHAPGTSSVDLPNSAADHASTLQLAESFPFMTQEQLLQLLSSNAALPSLLPPFLGSLPLGLWTGTQPPTTGGTQTQPANNLLNQASPLSVLPSALGPQGDLPLNLVSLLNPPAPGPTLAPGVAPGLEAGEKNPGLQALLMASLLLGQNPAAMLPLPGLNLDLPPLQQVFGEGVSLEKTPALLDSVLMGPGLLDALQALAPHADGQSLLLSAQLTPPPPPPPAFLSLNPALLAAALAQAETLPNHTPPPPPHTQGTLSSPALVSTSVSCTPLVPVTGQETCDSLTEQEKTNSQTPQFLPTILPQGVLGDLAALGNINSLHGLLAAGPLLLSQAPSLGMPLPQNQAALNPLTCLQLSMGPTLMGEKPLAVHETTPAQEDLPAAQLCQDSLLNPGHLQPPTQQREEPAGAGPGLIDPYGSFMDTIYTSFLQVSGRGSEGASDCTPVSYPELAPSLSPRRACSVHNPDLSRLSMEAAQSPARGTPKLSEDPPTTPPCKPAESRPPDAPLHLTFMEEAKTDGSAKLCVYSNGIGSGARRDDDGEEERRQAPGYLSPRERVNIDPVDDTMGNVDTEQGRALEIRTGARRGRKRKQTLQRGPEFPGDIERIIEEPAATIALQRPARGKRRRVVR
ncbi:methyl-CpG-binding domain protein 6 [Pangasianodon hypophthalmus]|uniref:methyl-CpG-binding domain protein 6 n=1 Tax=Pangasianodon hypophthalmus TaxID=310915 RepID=UPI00147B631A|nr:methyl-CpG-binding domain protein 6 [Pangasianodon hypophthalmus]XP_026774231.2 methyl-CpG-binding domain protein 6 [Pangasianodon hypophthalmus]